MVLLLPTLKTRHLDTALLVFRERGGTLRTRDMIALGVHTDALYALRESGRVVELGRGLYRLAEVGEAEHPDLAVVAARAPNAAPVPAGDRMSGKEMGSAGRDSHGAR